MEQVYTVSERLVRKFSAPWCGQCKQVQPLLEKIAGEFGATIEEVNIEDRPEEAKALGIHAIPSIFLYQGSDLRVSRNGIGRTTPDNLREVFKEAYEG